MKSKAPQVVIVGGGFAGIQAARELIGKPVEVVLVDRRNHHTFQPLLYQVALAVLSPAQIAQPIRSILHPHANVEVLMDEVVGIDVVAQTVSLGSGAVLEYDDLVLAAGATHSYFGNDGWKEWAPGLKTVEDATEIRRRILLAYELAERHSAEHGWHPPLRFVIIGGGPTGVELAGAISDLARLSLGRDFRHIRPAESEVLLIEGAKRVLASFPEDLSARAEEQLRRLGVKVRLGVHVTDVQPGYVSVGEERIEASVTLWAAGVAASPLGKMLGVEVTRRGTVPVDSFLNPSGLRNVFVCGDLAEFQQDGRIVPGVAQPAMQMGRHAAREILADLKGKPRAGFRYFDKGDMATIGRLAAVAKIEWPFRAHWSGFPAWLTWLVVHIYFLIGFRNRLAILTSWAWTYLTSRESARLITGATSLPGWEQQVEMGDGKGAKAEEDGTGTLIS
jgi:NADH dehydrogenase